MWVCPHSKACQIACEWGITNHWTGLPTGLAYFWYLHILWLDLSNLASQGPSENLQSTTELMSVRSG